MTTPTLRRFEPLENRFCLSVSVAVIEGGLVASGNANGAVEIVAVSEEEFRLTDNGVLIADESTLNSATDAPHIGLEETEGTNDMVTVGGCGHHGEDLGRALETLALNGRNLGFFYRGLRR